MAKPSTSPVRTLSRWPWWVLLAALAVLGLAAGAQSSGRNLPPAGTNIENVAQAEYYLSGFEGLFQHDSNLVRLRVSEVEDFTLVADRHTEASYGEVVHFAHTLTNTGNTALKITLDLRNLTNDDFDLGHPVVVLDVNGNGRADAGEPVLAPGSVLDLRVGTPIHLVVVAEVSTRQPTGAQAKLLLSAQAASGLTRTNTDTVEITGGVDVGITKGVNPAKPTVGGELTYVIGARIGDAGLRPQPVNIKVDGQPRALVYVRDRLPANTVLVALDTPQGRGYPLYHAYGAAADEYTTVPPARLTDVDYVGYGVEPEALGQGFSFSFRVQLLPHAGGTIKNTAYLIYIDPSTGQTVELPSNATASTLGWPAPVIAFYTDPSFTRETQVAILGRPLYVQATVGAANQDPGVAETVIIRLKSALTGDYEEFLAVETGPNTGIFRILEPWVPTADEASAALRNGTIETQINDVIEASVTDPRDQTAVAHCYISPTNVVFDSLTNELVPGTSVAMYKVSAGRQAELAEVFEADGTTVGSNPVQTDAQGAFHFYLAAPGTYRLEVIPPQPYHFPSERPLAEMPADRTVLADQSFGREFTVPADRLIPRADVPVDMRVQTDTLRLDKTAERNYAEIGDTLNYRLSMTNIGQQTVTDITVVDRLPQGFRYVERSARVADATLTEVVAEGLTVKFSLESLAPGDSATIVYRVRIGSQARTGRNTNVAVARGTVGTTAVHSNDASATVEISGGVFSDRGVLAGTVFVDLNGNKLQDPEDPGVPGVMVLTDDGTYVITDSEGKYSLYGLRSGTHLAKVDTTTLPAGAELVRLTNRHDDMPSTAWVDMKNGELFRADFALRNTGQELLDEVEARRAHGDPALEGASELERPLRREDALGRTGDVRGLPSSGTIGKVPVPGMAPVGDPPLANNLPPAPVAEDQAAHLESMVSGLDNSLGFVGLSEGATMPSAQATLRVKSDPESDIKLYVNGVEVEADRLGNELLIADRALRIREYYGIRLQRGPNVLEAALIDPFGNERGRVALNVVAPGSPAKLTLSGPVERPAADGLTIVPLQLTLTDDQGVPISARTPVTLETSLGEWHTADLDEVEPGLQVLVTGGSGEVELIAPRQAGEAVVRATVNMIESRLSVRFVPFLRPLVGAGVLEARVGVGLSSGSSLIERPADPFESELRALADRFGDVQAGTRLSTYFKGRVLGNSLLTLSYDSEKDARERLFRDIQPEEYYPVYGDSAIKGYDAQSTSRLFARLENGMSFLQWGDMRTEPLGEAFQLGSYYRSLTGFLGHYETNRGKLNLYSTYDDARQITEEFPARGTSGPFILRQSWIRENSERVEVVTRDRNQPTLVLTVTPLTRFTDYTLDFRTGELLLRQPLPTLDGNMNRNSLRVQYEVEDGGQRYWVVGADGTWSVANNVAVGGSLVWDDNPNDPLQIRSANIRWQIDPTMTVTGELASSWSRTEGSGGAGRIEFAREGRRLRAQAYAIHTGSKFYNPTALANRGRTELGLKGHYLLDNKTRLTAETIFTRDELSEQSLTGMQLFVARQLGPDAELELGVRHAQGSLMATIPGLDATQAAEAEKVNFTTARAKISGTMPGVRALRVYGEYETDLTDLSKRVLALGAEYQLNNRLRAYARHELLSSISGRYMLDEQHQQNITQLGIEADYMRDGQIFSEYRTQDAFNGRETQAAMGVRNKWNLMKNLSVDTSFEHINTFEGLGNNDSLSATGQFMWKPDNNWVTTGRLEGRWADSSNTALGSLGVAGKINRDWSLLGRFMWSSDSRRGDYGSGNHTQTRLALGAAYRDTERSRVSGLMRYELRADRNSDELTPTSRLNHILSGNVNWRVADKTVLMGRYAAKFGTDKYDGLRTSTSGQLLSARVLHDLSKRWDLGLTTSYRFGGGESGFAAGAEVGYQLGGGLWVSGGWNYSSYRDNDLTGLGYTDNGPYIRLRYKFDEGLLR